MSVALYPDPQKEALVREFLMEPGRFLDLVQLARSHFAADRKWMCREGRDEMREAIELFEAMYEVLSRGGLS